MSLGTCERQAYHTARPVQVARLEHDVGVHGGVDQSCGAVLLHGLAPTPNVRFAPETGHPDEPVECPLMTQSGLPAKTTKNTVDSNLAVR